jgi:para-nitrobenzyl esterase
MTNMRAISAIGLVACLLSATSVAAQRSAKAARATAVIDAGRIVGVTQDGVDRFLGIPFAKPPVGPLRWKPPVAPAPWTDARDATRFALPCFQKTDPDGVTANLGGVSGPSSEDCLYLNVFTPAERTKPAPVMVWFFGGGNEVGGGHLPTYDGQSFARDGVVIVTLNYRLGAAGWFGHPSLSAAAAKDEPQVNYGNMDQTEALRWVKRNIAAFGGDPDNVTIFGQSAGGYGVYSQLVSPKSAGLFKKAIVHSATYTRPMASMAELNLRGVRKATEWGLDGAKATAEQLRAVPIQKLGSGIGGAIDGQYVVEPWMTSLAFKRHPKVPFVVGGNSGEGGLWARDRWIATQFAEGGTHVRASLDQAKGAIHSAELQFAWDTLGKGATAADAAVARSMHSCWVAFAFYTGTGDVNCGNGLRWPAFTQGEHPVIEFTTNGAAVNRQFRKNEDWLRALATDK